MQLGTNLFSTYYHLLSPSSCTESKILRSTAYIIIFVTPYRVTIPLDLFFFSEAVGHCKNDPLCCYLENLASSSAKYVNKNDIMSRDLQSIHSAHAVNSGTIYPFSLSFAYDCK